MQMQQLIDRFVVRADGVHLHSGQKLVGVVARNAPLLGDLLKGAEDRIGLGLACVDPVELATHARERRRLLGSRHQVHGVVRVSTPRVDHGGGVPRVCGQEPRSQREALAVDRDDLTTGRELLRRHAPFPRPKS